MVSTLFDFVVVEPLPTIGRVHEWPLENVADTSHVDALLAAAHALMTRAPEEQQASWNVKRGSPEEGLHKEESDRCVGHAIKVHDVIRTLMAAGAEPSEPVGPERAPRVRQTGTHHDRGP